MNSVQAKTYIKRAFLIAILIFILWQIPSIINSLKVGVVSVAEILWSASIPIEKRISSAVEILFGNKQKLVEENKQLKNTLQIVHTKMLAFEQVKQENEELKNILGRSTERNIVLGTVLSRPHYSPYDILFIDVGSRDKVMANALVVFENVALGVVDTVYKRSAKVRLFSSPETKTLVTLEEGRIPATAYGRGGGALEIKLPHSTSVKEGDIISYPGLSNYILGIVVEVNIKPTSPFKTISFRTPVNIFTMRHVVVMLDPARFYEE